MLELTDVSAGYGRLRAIHNVSMKVGAGELVLILGPNGAGKSTLLRAMSGLIGCMTGRIFLSGREITRLPAHKRAKSGLSLVPEGRGVFPGMSVADNLSLGKRLGGSRNNSDPGLDDYLFSLFPRLGERHSQDCASLSGGEMQMLAIARAIAGGPKALLLDEPSLGLAPLLVADVYKALGELSDKGLSMVLVEQKEVPLWRVADQTFVLNAGRVVRHVVGGTLTRDELADLYVGDHDATTI